MSYFYKENNDEKTEELYLKRQIYKGNIIETEYDNLIDFYSAERYLYGRVNYKYVPVVFDPTATPFATLSTTNTEQPDLKAAAFVVAAFNKLNEQFDKMLLNGANDGNDPFLAKLEVKKAYQNPHTLYIEYLSQVRESLISIINRDKINFSNMQEFKTIFIDAMKTVSKKMPITYPGFIKSTRCPMNVSGLVIEIADIDYANDEQKILLFKNQSNNIFLIFENFLLSFILDDIELEKFSFLKTSSS